jgi:hypothetical protein
MFVLCDGMLRSGSTWSFNVALMLLRSGDTDRETFGLYNEKAAVLGAALRPRSTHVVVKSHVLDPSNYDLCRTGAVKAIYTWRDPYDVVASCLRMFGSPVEDCLQALRSALQVWAFHIETNSAWIVPYESIISQPAEVIANLACYLGLAMRAEHVNQIAAEMSFENVRDFSRRVNQLGSRRVIRRDGHVFDRQTLLHQGHITNGRSGYGAKRLGVAELAAIDAILVEEGFGFLRKSARKTVSAGAARLASPLAFGLVR